jgi:hypothetical protein
MTRQRTFRNPVTQPQHVLEDVEIQIVVPTPGTNVCTNPSFEEGTVGWTNTGGTVTRQTDRAFYGIACGRIQSDSGGNGGSYFNTSWSGATVCTVSFAYQQQSGDAFGARVEVSFRDGSNNIVGIYVRNLRRGNTTKWHQFAATFQPPSTATQVRLTITGAGGGTQTTVWLDGVQIEPLPYATTFIDGTQQGCTWTGVAHRSVSTRSATTRAGGRPMSLKQFGLTVTALIGFAAAPTSPIVVPYAQIGGADYQQSLTPMRTLTIAGVWEHISRAQLINDRRALHSAVRPEATVPQQPVRMFIRRRAEHDIDQADAIVVDAVYAGGLEGNQTTDFGIETAAMTFNVYLPYAALGTSLGTTTQALAGTTTQTLNYFFARDYRDGSVLPNPAANPGGVINVVHVTWEGRILVGGTFGIREFDPVTSTFITVDDGGGAFVPANVTAISTLNMGGGTTLIMVGQATSPYLGYNDSWLPSIGQKGNFSSFYVNGPVYALKFEPSTYLMWIGGNFTAIGNTVGTAISSRNIIYYDWNPSHGGAWGPSIASSMSGQVGVIETAPGWPVFIGAGQTGSAISAVNSVTTLGLAQYTIGVGWQAVGGGVQGGGGFVVDMEFGADGALYVGGIFTTAAGTSIPVSHLAKWNGFTWSPVGSGVSAQGVGALKRIPEGMLVAGNFNTAGGKAVGGTALWTGSTFLRYDIETYPTAQGIFTLDYSAPYLVGGGNFTTNLLIPGTTTVNVPGNEVAFPRVTFTAANANGSITSLRNWATGQVLYFDLVTVPNEVLTLQTGASFEFTSNLRGDLRAVLYGSDPRAFRLNPGDNRIQLTALNVTTTLERFSYHTTIDMP